jgi:hypothetical protein
MSRLACIMPIGPGEADRHLERCLRAARSWADIVICYGDGADPATRNLIGSYAHIGTFGQENLYETGEHLVRNELLALADRHLATGDIVCALDADEEFAAAGPAVRNILRSLDGQESWNVHFLHLWDPAGTVHRVDGLWQPSIGPRIYVHRPGYRLQPLYESAWVCPPLPPHLLRAAGPAVLDVLHWSYARPEHRRPKYERYSRLPGHHPAHIESIIGEPVLEPVPCRA